MEYKITRRIPDEAARFLREAYSMDLEPLSKEYIYIYSMGKRGIKEVWLVSSHPFLDRLDLKIFKRWGFRMLRRRGQHLIPSNTFIQVFGDYMARNIIIVKEPNILEEIFIKTYVVLDNIKGGIEEVRHTDYPYKILRYKGISVGLVKKHSRGYISLLPRKYGEIRFL